MNKCNLIICSKYAIQTHSSGNSCGGLSGIANITSPLGMSDRSSEQHRLIELYSVNVCVADVEPADGGQLA
jgi:hypothetical protein